MKRTKCQGELIWLHYEDSCNYGYSGAFKYYYIQYQWHHRPGIFKQVALLQGYTQNDIDVWWGVYTGKYKLLINVPISIASAMAASFVPVLTGAYHRDDMEAVRGQINLSTRFIMVVAFPCAVGLAVFGLPIFNILFSSTRATNAEASLMMYVGAVCG